MRSGKPSQRAFMGLLCAICGVVCVGLFCLVDESHRDYGRRWAALLFGVLMLVAGFQFLKESFRRRISAELDELLNSAARTIFYGGFGGLALGGAVGLGAEIRGGLPFVPESVNVGFGRALFAAAGLALCGVGLYCLSRTLVSLRKYLAARSASRRHAPYSE